MPRITLTGSLTCTTPAEAETVAQYLPDHISLSRAEPGCLMFSVTQTTDPLIWQVDESFATRDAFDAHQARTRASAWFRATAHIARAFQITEG
ncbi:MAG: antibiotic biosynthesis monooxygenase [Paracoccaceae bacterium]|nr:antibiotic biosynthesis monooxygenase [Paracoccaceae bacterium]